MRHGQPSLFEQQTYEAGQEVTVTITGTIAAVRPAGHDHVVLAIEAPTNRPDHKRALTYVMVGDPQIKVENR